MPNYSLICRVGPSSQGPVVAVVVVVNPKTDRLLLRLSSTGFSAHSVSYRLFVRLLIKHIWPLNVVGHCRLRLLLLLTCRPDFFL